MRSEYFSFDGKNSLEMGYYSVRVGTVEAKQELLGDRKIKASSFGNKTFNYINSVETSPIEFTLQIIPTKDRQWTTEMFSNVCDWLIQDEYKPFISEDDPSKVLYAIAQNNTDWKGVMLYGYIEIEFVTNAYHAWTKPKVVEYSIDGNQTIFVDNLKNVGDRIYSPVISITKTKEAGDISICNQSHDGKTTLLTKINKDEHFVMNNEFHLFQSDTPKNYYGENFNGVWLDLVQGRNKLEITGDCTLEFRFQFPIV